MEWLKNNAVVVFIIIGLITYIEVRLSDLKADLKADNQELRAELKDDIRGLQDDIRGLQDDIVELRGDIKEIRSLLVTYILKDNVGSESPLVHNPKKPDLKPKKTLKPLPANNPASPVAVPKSKTLSDLAQRERE